MRLVTAGALLGAILSAAAALALTDAWSVDVRKPGAVQRTYLQGESWDIAVTLRDGLAPLSLTNATATFYWYTNAAQNVWWTNAAAVAGSTVTASWTPAMDVGASSYPFWIGIWQAGATSPLWRVAGNIRLLASPGFAPNSLPLPRPYIDFSAIIVTNAPWATPAALLATSNALAGAVQAEAALRLSGDASGTQHVAAVRAELLATNAVTRDAAAAAAALAGSALQPSWAATGTVRRAIYADEAARIVQADSNAWITVEHGTNWLYTIGSASNVYVVSVSGEGYNGPAVGSMWTNATHNETSWSWTDNGDATLLASGPEDINNCTVFSTYVMGVDALFVGGVDDTAPATLIPHHGNAVGSLVVDFAPVTNRVQVMTVPGTVILISEHDADGAAHPTLPRHSDVTNALTAATNGLISGAQADAKYFSTVPGWYWQGSQAVATNAWTAAYSGYAAYTNSRYELVPYTTSRHDVTGQVAITSGNYIVAVGLDWHLAQPVDVSIPKNPMYFESLRTGPTSWVLRAWCSTSPGDANSFYYAYASNVVVWTYDRQDMTPGLYTNDAAGIVARADDAPTNDPRRVVNYGTMQSYVEGRKTEIADKAWRRTPGGRDAPSAYTVTLDQPLVQQGAIAFLNSGDYYCMSYQGGDWYSSPTGSTWRIGPSGTVAFEIQSTNRLLHVQGFAVSGGYATLDISTNWVTGGYSPEIEFSDDLVNPQWLACPEQTMTNAVSYWRGTCPATTDRRFYRVVLRNGAARIVSHYMHQFNAGIVLFGVEYESLAELKAALEALP